MIIPIELENMNINPPQIASMNVVTMSKASLIEILKDNKEKHDAIFEAALAGYWEEAEKKVKLKLTEYKKAVLDLNEDVNYQFDKFLKKLDRREPLDNLAFINIKLNFSASLGIVFPENHSKDYEKAIRKLELSIYDTVSLSEDEYEQYVLNNWEWKEKFLISNSGYLDKAVIPVSSAKKYGKEFLTSVARGRANF